MSSHSFRTIAELENLGEASLQTGPFGTQLKASEYVDKGIPVINVRNIGFGDVKKEDLEYLNDAKAEKLHQHHLRKGDIVFGRKGAVERHALIDETVDGWIQGSDCLRLRIRSQDICERYLSHYFKTKAHQDWMQALCSFGATMSSLNQDIVRRISFPAPPIIVQKKITATLTAYDKLIENNQRRIALLEKMAEEIYREWFVRLRFPGYEKVKKVKGVPEGWEIDRVDSIGKIVTGKTPPTDNPRYFGGPYFFIKTPDMHGNIFIVETEERLSQNGLDSQPSQTIPRGSICVSCIGTGGIVSITTSECQTNQQINSVVVRNLSDLEWAFFSLRNLREAIQMFGATGATMTNLSKGKFSSLKILRPNKSIVLKYHALVNPIFAQMQSILQQTMILRSTRDLLLPRLISGKLSVEQLDIRFPPGMEESAHVNRDHQRV